MDHTISESGWERTVLAVAHVRDRLRRTVQALEQNAIPYAIAGGHAVAAWVSEVGEGGV